MSSPEEAVEAGAAKPQKKIPVPMWWKNTYFWIGAFLLIVFLVALIKGPASVRDPGQKREDHLVAVIYFVGAIVMFVNGWVSHRQTVQEYNAEMDLNG